MARIEIPDQAAARLYLDLSRVGIYGHSWGGWAQAAVRGGVLPWRKRTLGRAGEVKK